MNASFQSRRTSLLLGFATVFTSILSAVAAPEAIATTWVKVASNDAQDGFFIDTDSIKRNGQKVVYWEYREFSEPNNAFLENEVSKPLYGVVIRWTAYCDAKTQRLGRVNAFTKDRVLIQKFDYGEKGTLNQPRPGSSGYEVLDMACNPKKLDLPRSKPTK